MANLPLVVLLLNWFAITNLISVNSLRVAAPYKFSPNQFLPPPKIWLSEYSKDDSYEVQPAEKEFRALTQFETDLISKNGSDYVIYQGIELLTFTCQAKYPVKWTLPDVKQYTSHHYNLRSKFVRISQLSGRMDQPTNRYFKSFLTLRYLLTDFLSVTFSCKSLDDSNGKGFGQSNIHIYLGDGSHVLEKEGETLLVSVPTSSQDIWAKSEARVIIPCRPAIPTLSVTLEKQGIDGKSWKPISSKLSSSFDPRIGFTLSGIFWGKKSWFWGLYRCFVNGTESGQDEDAIVFVNVTADSNTTAESLLRFEPHLWKGKGNATVKYFNDRLYYQHLECCSGKGFSGVPKAYLDSCSSPIECDVLRATFLTSIKSQNADTVLMRALDNHSDETDNCTSIYLFESPVLVVCQGENLDYANEFVEVFLPGISQIENRKFQMKSHDNAEVDHSRRKLLTVFEDVAEVGELDVNQKQLIVVGHKMSPDDIKEGKMYGGLMFSLKDYTKLDAIVDSDESVWKAESVDLVEYDRNFYYEDEPLQFICLGLQYFHSDGPHLLINWKNGSRSVIERSEDGQYTFNFAADASTVSGFREYFVPIVGKEINASLEMDSVECFMPVWNSSKWDRITYNLNVTESYAPKFSGDDEEEVVYLHLNDTNEQISCEFLGGKPFPEISITKDGKELTSKFFDSGGMEEDEETRRKESDTEENLIKIKFKVVTYEMHGTYQFICKNVKGAAIKRIKVIVTEKSSIAVPIGCASAVTLSVLVIMIGIKSRLQLREIWRLKMSNLNL